MSLQFSPLMVSRRPGNAPGGVGPCARRCARSSRRGGVEIDGAQVPRRSRRRRKRQSGPTAAPCTTITADLLLPRCMQVAVSMEKLPGTCFAGGGANELELRRSLWLEAGSVRQWRRAKTGPTAAPSSQVKNYSPGNMEQASSRGHEASPQSGPLCHHDGCSALAPLHAGCHWHGEAARDLFCGQQPPAPP